MSHSLHSSILHVVGMVVVLDQYIHTIYIVHSVLVFLFFLPSIINSLKSGPTFSLAVVRCPKRNCTKVVGCYGFFFSSF